MNGAALLTAYTLLRSGTLWTNQTKTGYADLNPGEADKLTAYVTGIATGAKPTPPTLSTKTGRGLLGLLRAAAGEPTTAIAAGVPTYGGALTIVTTPEHETTVIEVDGREVARMGPQASYKLDTTQLANGGHTILFRYLGPDGKETRRSDTAPFQVVN